MNVYNGDMCISILLWNTKILFKKCVYCDYRGAGAEWVGVISGVNWKQNSRQVPVVTQEPDELKATELRAKFYGPYYEMLKALIFELINKNPPGNIVDLHSMPSRATAYHMQQKPDQREQRPDFCLSDQFGASCVPAFIQNIQTAPPD